MRFKKQEAQRTSANLVSGVESMASGNRELETSPYLHLR